MTAVGLYGGYWPFPRLRWIRVSACSFSVELRSYGRFQFSLPLPRGLPVLDLAPDTLVGIQAPSLPAFAGVIDEVEEETETGSVRVTGREFAAVLAERLTPQAGVWPSANAALLAEEELRRASARNPTGLDVGLVVPGGVAPQTIETRGSPLQDLFEELSDLSGYEWAFAYECGARLRVTWQWMPRAGTDARTAIHLRALSDAAYGRSLWGGGLLVRAVGGTVTFSDRPSHVRVRGGSAPFHNRLGEVVEAEPGSIAAVSVLHAAEADILDPAASTARAVSSLTRTALERPWVFSERVEFALPLQDWPAGLAVGSTVGVRLPAARFGAGLVRPCRILGYQADLSEGTVSAIGGIDEA